MISKFITNYWIIKGQIKNVFFFHLYDFFIQIAMWVKSKMFTNIKLQSKQRWKRKLMRPREQEIIWTRWKSHSNHTSYVDRLDLKVPWISMSTGIYQRHRLIQTCWKVLVSTSYQVWLWYINVYKFKTPWMFSYRIGFMLNWQICI